MSTTDVVGADSDEANKIRITVAAPNNESRDLHVHPHARIDEVSRQAVGVFVEERLMEHMECSLALVLDGEASPLDDATRVVEIDVDLHLDVRLVLVPKRPKTDG